MQAGFVVTPIEDCPHPFPRLNSSGFSLQTFYEKCSSCNSPQEN